MKTKEQQDCEAALERMKRALAGDGKGDGTQDKRQPPCDMPPFMADLFAGFRGKG